MQFDQGRARCDGTISELQMLITTYNTFVQSHSQVCAGTRHASFRWHSRRVADAAHAAARGCTRPGNASCRRRVPQGTGPTILLPAAAPDAARLLTLLPPRSASRSRCGLCRRGATAFTTPALRTCRAASLTTCLCACCSCRLSFFRCSLQPQPHAHVTPLAAPASVRPLGARPQP